MSGLVVGSVIGGLARHGCNLLMPRMLGEGFPYGTFAANMLGCLLIGAFDGLSGRWSLSPAVRLALITGFCGAFTTFSSLILETSRQLDSGAAARAAVNIVGSLILGFMLLRLGTAAGRALSSAALAAPAPDASTLPPES